MAFQLELAPLRVEDYFAPLLYDDFSPFGHRQRSHRHNQRQELMGLLQEANRRAQIKNGNFELTVDVDGFKPEDLNVKVEDNFLTVTGKHEEKGEDGKHFVSRQFMRRHLLPKDVNLDAIKSTLATDGSALRVTAPLKNAVEAPKEHNIPIDVVRGGKQQQLENGGK